MVWGAGGQLGKGYLLYIRFQSLPGNEIEVPNVSYLEIARGYMHALAGSCMVPGLWVSTRRRLPYHGCFSTATTGKKALADIICFGKKTDSGQSNSKATPPN